MFECLPRMIGNKYTEMCCKRRYILVVMSVTSISCLVWCADVGDTYFGKHSETCFGEECPDSPAKSENPGGIGHESIDVDLTADASNSNPTEINVIVTFTNAEYNQNLQNKLRIMLSSLFRHASVPLALHFIGEAKSQQIAENILRENAENATYRVVKLDVDKLAQELHTIVEPMQKHFSSKPGSYYSHSFFFLSVAMHMVMPKSMRRAIMLDADLKFMDDIKILYDRFRLFKKDNVIGIARELQPVYRHTFSLYRSNNPGTRVGEPGPDGLTGFNSGVLLLDLEAMRKSDLYNSMLTSESVERLTNEFHFRGHLGDQDLFTLINMKYEWLFHVLPCTWNRQLCTWWKDHGYADVFDQYYTCEGDIKIWHGNCNTPIPY